MAANNNDTFFARMFGGMNFYGFNPETYNRNLAALNAANKLFVEYFQTINKRNQQIAQEAFEDYTNAMRDLLSAASSDEKVAQQMDVLKNAFEKGIANAGELSEMYAKSSREAIEIFTKRASDAIEETKAELKKAKIAS